MHEQLSSSNPSALSLDDCLRGEQDPYTPFCWSCAAFHKRSQHFDIFFHPKVITKVPRTQNRHIQIQHPHSVPLGGQHSENKVCVCVRVCVRTLIFSLHCTEAAFFQRLKEDEEQREETRWWRRDVKILTEEDGGGEEMHRVEGGCDRMTHAHTQWKVTSTCDHVTAHTHTLHIWLVVMMTSCSQWQCWKAEGVMFTVFTIIVTMITRAMSTKQKVIGWRLMGQSLVLQVFGREQGNSNSNLLIKFIHYNSSYGRHLCTKHWWKT